MGSDPRLRGPRPASGTAAGSTEIRMPSGQRQAQLKEQQEAWRGLLEGEHRQVYEAAVFQLQNSPFSFFSLSISL